MLLGLHIENVAAIEKIDIEFKGGFNVLSGETGAGKSIIIDSINLVAGARASRDIIRGGCDSLLVQALFVSHGEETLLSREVYADGRSVSRVNGTLSTAAAVRELMPDLLSIHGQHDNHQLAKSENHLDILDRFAVNDNLLSEYEICYREMKDAEQKLKRSNENAGEIAMRIDMLKFQINEIDSANLKSGEEQELCDIRLKLQNAEKITSAVEVSRDMLYGNNSVHDLLSSVSNNLSSVSGFDSKLSEVLDSIENASAIIDDAAHELGRYAAGIESNPVYLSEVEDRLDIISKLKRKYGLSEEAVLNYREKIGIELSELEEISNNSEWLEDDLKLKSDKAKLIASKITASRKNAAKKLCKQIADELEFLDMKSVHMDVAFKECGLSAKGAETAEFLIATNAGEDPKPLTKIASGGELSRIMLAIQTVLECGAETLIFDEIDSGVSGRAALKIGKKLYDISKNHQVICITHLAQIASMADCHFLIEKKTDGKTTKSSVSKLSGQERLSELARITGGVTITDLTLKNAEEMLVQAEKLKTEE